MKNFPPLCAALIFGSTAFLNGCGFTHYKTPGANPGSISSPSIPAQAATFAQVYQQVIQPKCLGCHASGSSPNFSSYESFAANTSVIVSGHPEQSAFYTATQSGDMPRGGQPLNSDELGLIYSWIESGAQNN